MGLGFVKCMSSFFLRALVHTLRNVFFILGQVSVTLWSLCPEYYGLHLHIGNRCAL